VPRPSPLQADIAAALDWWREAGVDSVYTDDPRAWLSDPAAEAQAEVVARKQAPPPAAPEAPKFGGPSAGWPQDLASFRHWWMTEPSLDEGGLAPRISPIGEPGRELMVLVAMPEETDRDALLSGPQGRLLDGFLKAAGLGSQQVYKASVLSRHTPLADWSEFERKGIGAILAHHVGVAQPKRLLVLGRSILSLCGHDPAQGSQKLRSFNHEGATVPALYEVGLERLLTNWQSRARLWQRWLEWTDGNTWREGSS
jgi:uracil-DNA glycosylase